MNSEFEELISCRNSTLSKTWINELWVRVVFKAIDDLASFTRMYEDGEYISEENIFHANTAYNLFFNSEHEMLMGMTFQELLSVWGFHDVNSWRESIKDRVRELVKEKRLAKCQRRKSRCTTTKIQ